MADLEQKIKDFVKKQDVDVVGIAGPERLNGPPSLNPTYTLKGAKSVVAFAIPMDVNAIYEFLGKKSSVSHNLDQLKGNQRVNRIGNKLAEFIRSEGYRAREVAANTNYRRSLNPIFVIPTFSHRFAAIAAGIGGQGLSGNVMIEGYGAAVYLGSVVTDAVLESDPAIDPRYFMDNYCAKCKLCEKSCASGMFLADEEEAVLINGELHPRGKRRNMMFCMTTCFGMHALSRDKKWTTWGRHWIKDWIGDKQDPNDKGKIRRDFAKAVATAGDSAPRYDVIRESSSELHPQELLENKVPDYKDLPKDELDRNKLMEDLVEENFGIKGLVDPNVLTCGQCALVCGPNLDETAQRYHLLIESGLVVPGEEGRMVNCNTYEEACEIKKKYPQRVSGKQMRADRRHLAKIFTRRYFGIEPKSIIQGLIYDRKLKKALKAH